jgi:hypothetical protein
MFVTPLLPLVPQQPLACAAVPLSAVIIVTAAMYRIETLIVGLPELSKPVTQIRCQFFCQSIVHMIYPITSQSWHVTCVCSPEKQKSGYQGQLKCN